MAGKKGSRKASNAARARSAKSAATPSSKKVAKFLDQMMNDPEIRVMLDNQERAREQLNKLTHAMIFDPDVRKLLDGDSEMVSQALDKLDLSPANRDDAIAILENFNYAAVRKLSKAFGLKDDSLVN